LITMKSTSPVQDLKSPWSPTGRKGGAHMPGDDKDSRTHPKGLVELTRVQPFEAEVIAARLRASGIAAIVGADSVYPSVTFADGVPVLVSSDDASQALALLEGPEEAH
jgi:hypothetical protein